MRPAKIPQINIIAGNVPNHPVFNQRAPVYYRSHGNQERCMNKSAIRLLTLAMYAMALIAVPLTTAYAAGGDNPSPPASDTKKEKKKSNKSSSIDDPKFLEGYRAAYATIYDRNDYSSAIEQLKALGQDDRADVANLIGYSYRKLGDYKVSQIWYERALKADPDHVRTWQYYGLWQVEQGNRDQAQYHLNRIAALTGTSSDEYRSLAAALEKPPGTGLVY
jgi:tetratricopeptide (TPR) repeat protein